MAAKSKGLGKGLGSLLGDVADISISRNSEPEVSIEPSASEKMVKLRMIEPNREQPRKDFEEESLQELADSIKQYGVIQPLIVVKRDKHYEIVAGERRWRAAKMAGLKEVPVIEKEFTDVEIAEISLIENIQRQDLNPVEEAMAYDRLINEFNLTQEELSERVSKSRTVITNSLRLLKLPEEIKDMLIEGKISTGHAKVLLGVTEAEKQIELANKVAVENLSVRELEALVRADKNKKEKKEEPLQNQLAYDEAINRLKEKLGTKVSIKRKSENSGKIEISYFSIEDIERILAHIK